MPRCTRCNTPLGGASGEEATRRDPDEGRPLPPPWADRPQDPPGWNAPPPPPGGDPGETSISLSPEPWDEPPIWQPPQPARRRDVKLYLLIAVGAVALAAVATLIVVWPSGDDRGGPGTGAQPQQTSQTPTGDDTGTPPDDTTSTAASGDAAQQARAVDGLLSEMASTRSQLQPIAGDCDRSGLGRIASQRQAQLDRARSMRFDKLPSGPQMQSALVRALEASVESSRTRQSEGCPATPLPADNRATSAKQEFIGYWNSVAAEHDLPSRSEGDI
ncbi:hypothetical protein ACSNOI_29790 [Actinomadura kijaniata]|uniref:hypothetical protein n=1 Tax=Actinomadura kijaniata TaxID=46161 RepID=UPI003F1BCB89